MKINYLLINNQRLVSLINPFIGLLIIVAAFFLIRNILLISISPKEKIVVNEKNAERVLKHNLLDYAGILQNNPFGFPAGDLKSISGQTALVSSTDVSLIGTVSGKKSLSYAIFMKKTGEQEVFGIGDPVFGLGILDKVEQARVFIGTGEGSMEIPLKDIFNIKEEPKSRGTRTVSSGFTKKISEGRYSIDQRKIQQAIANPKDLMTDARLMPNIIDGKQQGFKLAEVKRGGIYQSIGLKNGDILLRINEYDISHPETALQAFTALRGMETVQLDIVRNGAKMTMTYQIK